MSDSGSSFAKWAGGIIGSILTGLVLWWLTGPLSPFTNKSDARTEVSSGNYTSANDVSKPADPDLKKDAAPIVEKKADVVISSYSLKSPINISTYTTCDFEVTNKGDGPANGCQLIWETPGLNGNKTSESFDLAAGEKKNFQLVSNVFDKAGTYNLKAHLSCSNTSQIEEVRPLVVNFMMQAKPLQ